MNILFFFLRCLDFLGNSLSLIAAEVCPFLFFPVAPKRNHSVVLLSSVLPPEFFNSFRWTFPAKCHSPKRLAVKLPSEQHGLRVFQIRRIQIWFTTLQFRNFAQNLQVWKDYFFLFCDVRRKGLNKLILLMRYFIAQPSDTLRPFRMCVDDSVLRWAQRNIQSHVEVAV